jgi:hypothetical protein
MRDTGRRECCEDFTAAPRIAGEVDRDDERMCERTVG